MKDCKICAPFNERDSTVYKTIGTMVHDTLGLMDTYPEHRHLKVESLLKRIIVLWHLRPAKKRLTTREKAIYLRVNNA